jgi:uncharacterized membrane protein
MAGDPAATQHGRVGAVPPNSRALAMKRPLELLRTALITGLIIVLPAWLALLLLLKLLVQLGVLVKPIAREMPPGVNHPQLVAALLFLVLCLLVGLLVRTAAGRLIGKTLGEGVFNRVPGYQSLRNIARQFADDGAKEGFKPALIEVEDGSLAPAFLIENHEQGLSTVFMPSVPTPMAGSIFIMPSARVHPIDVPVTTMMKCISKWGSGSSELLAALDAAGGLPGSRP